MDQLFGTSPDMDQPLHVNNWIKVAPAVCKIAVNPPAVDFNFRVLDTVPEYGHIAESLNVLAGSATLPFYTPQLIPTSNYGALGYHIERALTESLCLGLSAQLTEAQDTVYAG